MSQAEGGVWLPPGDAGLRGDLTLLVDTGRIEMTLSNWPIPRADIEQALANATTGPVSDGESAAIGRIQAWISRERRGDGVMTYRSSAAAAARPELFRTFDSDPRDSAQAGVSAEWEDGRWSGNLEATLVADSPDGQHVRPDGTYIGARAGNWLFSAGWRDRWWGPGRESSLILSTNARPMPGISLDRAVSAPFETRWLKWLGPWNYSMFLNQMDGGRQDVSRPLFFGQRLTIRPFRGLELAVSRTAQFCGSGRSCNVKTFKSMLFGNDNRGSNISTQDEPGNQMAGFDGRWHPLSKIPLAFYTQWIGEDLVGGPDKFLGLFGAESWFDLSEQKQLRVHLEFADTACAWYRSTQIYNCAYANGIFNVEGYRYLGRTMGASIDADGREISAGFDLAEISGGHWTGLLRRIELVRGGVVDTRNQASSIPREVSLAQLRYERDTRFGWVSVGMGISKSVDTLTDHVTHEGQGFLQFQHDFQ